MTTNTSASAKRKSKAGAFEAIHASAVALAGIGAINKATMRQFDDLCLVAVPQLDSTRIKRLRERLHVSQPIFAHYLNTSESTVQKWERGEKKPSGPSLKLLALVKAKGLEAIM